MKKIYIYKTDSYIPADDTYVLIDGKVYVYKDGIYFHADNAVVISESGD